MVICFYWMMLEIVSGEQDRGMHLLLCIAQLHTKPAWIISLPRIVLDMNPRLDSLKGDDERSKPLLARSFEVSNVDGAFWMFDRSWW